MRFWTSDKLTINSFLPQIIFFDFIERSNHPRVLTGGIVLTHGILFRRLSSYDTYRAGVQTFCAYRKLRSAHVIFTPKSLTASILRNICFEKVFKGKRGRLVSIPSLKPGQISVIYSGGIRNRGFWRRIYSHYIWKAFCFIIGVLWWYIQNVFRRVIRKMYKHFIPVLY